MVSVKRLFIALVTGLCVNAQATELSITLEIPSMNVAEYHNPYVAVWIMHSASREITNGTVWYQIDENAEGEKWLKDMRLWWRRTGRSLDVPIDGVTAATHKPGTYNIDLNHITGELKPGPNQLYIEAAREVGGRELLSVEFDWPVQQAQSLTVQGETELGDIVVTLQP
ncbi:DUF2271 domain-containing protein [Gilvimarinus sp. SDUM040013]|uniref:DUF2271 domain-containing protein n=1 Tax=Gilvimarinus gilvus TaxID=3058038 RepID=A0ABU4RYI8_9GAMM|nr:DUF2271 domain-containing protein [Gilvimarinus sp. SDUM040013]MDO3385668.1 DUF2271 domain-containing protein [Gilvimarinus sp. SDUM040013]MDX6849306.1 DUF2271 domain-containing protein [Gilvimarinus sp. SDUM040013]